MAMIQIEQEQQKQQQAEQYDMIHQWEARERERDGCPRPITADTQEILMQVGLLKFQEEAISSLKAHSVLLRYLIGRWNAHRQAFQVGPDQWYTPTEKEIYFITGLSRRGVDFSSFPDMPAGCVAGSQLVYSQRYIGAHVLSPSEFQVPGGQLHIGAFSIQDVQFLSLIILTISHNNSDGNALVTHFYIMLILQYNNHDFLGGLPFFLRQFCMTLVDVVFMHKGG